jgi:RNA polymerase sigma-70 factor (ECF subfamily)
VEDLTALIGADTPGCVDENELRNLMVRYQAGHRAAAEELILRLSPRLLGFLSGPRFSRSDAEDLLQECWLRIHRSRHTYRASDPLLPWIYAIARHTRLDGLRRQLRRARREVLVPEVPELVDRAKAADLFPNVFGLLDRLPESQREVILLLKVSGMTLEEVARTTSSSVGAIKQKAHRAYATLRELLQKGE